MTEKINSLLCGPEYIARMESTDNMKQHLAKFGEEICSNIGKTLGTLQNIPCYDVLKASIDLMRAIDQMKQRDLTVEHEKQRDMVLLDKLNAQVQEVLQQMDENERRNLSNFVEMNI